MSTQAQELISDELMASMSKLGLDERFKLIFHFPKRYLDFRNPDKSLADAMKSGKKEGDWVYLKARLQGKPKIVSGSGGKPARVSARVSDGVSAFFISRFGNTIPWRKVSEGALVHIHGTIEYDDYQQGYRVKNPDLVAREFQGRIAPYYPPRAKDFSSEEVETAVSVALDLFLKRAEGYVCENIGKSTRDIARHCSEDFQDVASILKEMHRPESGKRLAKAQKAVRLINAMYEIYAMRDDHERAPDARSSIYYDVDDIKARIEQIPFDLKKDQKLSIWKVTQQLIDKKPMDHLMYGDVGCGKTVSYLIPSILAHKKGSQVVIMTPNSLLSQQIYDDIQEFAPEISTALVSQGVKKKDIDAIDLSDKPVLIGTSSLFSFLEKREAQGEFEGADLVVFDEQQKLGSKQKAILIKPYTNIIESTATPVPRTVAHSIYGDKSTSYIEEPPAKKDIKSKIVEPKDRQAVFDELNRIMDQGDQIAIICPNRTHTVWFRMRLNSEESREAIEKNLKKSGMRNIKLEMKSQNNYEAVFKMDASRSFESKSDADEAVRGVSVTHFEEIDEKNNARDAMRNVELLKEKWEELFPGEVVAMHGGMKSAEKMEAMRKAHSNECRALITSSLIEIGLTFPRLRGILVQDAERLGISALHQIRGRLSRHGGEGVFYMGLNGPVDQTSEKSIDRLRAIEKEARGSRLAEIDMQQRGVGDLRKAGVIQSGNQKGLFPTLKVVPVDLAEFMQHTYDKAPENKPVPLSEDRSCAPGGVG